MTDNHKELRRQILERKKADADFDSGLVATLAVELEDIKTAHSRAVERARLSADVYERERVACMQDGVIEKEQAHAVPAKP